MGTLLHIKPEIQLHITDAFFSQQGVLRKDDILTHTAAVIRQRGSGNLFTASDEGKRSELPGL